MCNEKIRIILQERKIRHWVLAEKIGISEQTMVRWLRKPLAPEKEALIQKAIDQIMQERSA